MYINYMYIYIHVTYVPQSHSLSDHEAPYVILIS